MTEMADSTAPALEERIRHQYDAPRSGFLALHRDERPWGHEEWLVRTSQYGMKRLFVREGQQLSVQYHPEKEETLTVESGLCEFLLGAEGDLDPANAKWQIARHHDIVHISPYTVHAIRALEDTMLYEVSTPHLGPEHTVRLQDGYGRKTI
jgi:mannose-6-phosphate isomerase-like protein (cupin superfamily)